MFAPAPVRPSCHMVGNAPPSRLPGKSRLPPALHATGSPGTPRPTTGAPDAPGTGNPALMGAISFPGCGQAARGWPISHNPGRPESARQTPRATRIQPAYLCILKHYMGKPGLPSVWQARIVVVIDNCSRGALGAARRLYANAGGRGAQSSTSPPSPIRHPTRPLAACPSGAGSARCRFRRAGRRDWHAGSP